jgi:hypothetical protein
MRGVHGSEKYIYLKGDQKLQLKMIGPQKGAKSTKAKAYMNNFSRLRD